MKHWKWCCAAALAVVIAAGPAMAQRPSGDKKDGITGELGDKAPPLKVAEWVKGKKVDISEGKGKDIYVVEFWATWCGPCRESIPHLTQMQKKFKDQHVIFIGVSTEPTSTVKPFVQKMGDKMDYRVVCDEPMEVKKDGDKKAKKDADDDDDDDDDDSAAKKPTRGSTDAAYMGAFGINGIPHAFVINKDGVIAWHGHPMVGLEQALEKIVADKWDVAAERDRLANAEKSTNVMRDYLNIVARGKGNDKSKDLGEKFLKLNSKNAVALNELAWTILTHPAVKDRDKGFALRVAETAHELEPKDPAIMDTYARALYDNGKKAEAIKAEKKAIEYLADSEKLPKEQKAQWTKSFKKALATYEAGKPTKPETPGAGDDDDDDDDDSGSQMSGSKDHKPAAKHDDDDD